MRLTVFVRRKPTGLVGAVATLALVAGCAGPSAQSADSNTNIVRLADQATCQPIFNQLGDYGDIQYYRLSFQLMNCLPYDVPLSIDVGASDGSGTPLGNPVSGQTAPGGNVKGAGVIWDSNNGSGVQSNGPATIPASGGSGAGKLVGFTTVPYWDGYSAGQSGPCANSIVATDGSGNLNPSAQCEVLPTTIDPNAQEIMRSDFQGNWAVFTPTGTLEAYVDTPAMFGAATGQLNLNGYPYVSSYTQTPDVQNTPGAIATGIMLVRKSIDGEAEPFYYNKTADAPEGSKPYSKGPPSSSPPSGDFVASASCADQLVVENGQNAPVNPKNPTSQSIWNSALSDSGHNWFLTTVYAEGYSSQQPSLFFLKGWGTSNHGQTSTLGLQTPTNKSLSLKPHTFQAYLQDSSKLSCNSGNQKVQVLGGSLRSLDVSTAVLSNPLILNSTVRYANFSNTTTTGGGTVKSAIGYSLFLNGDDGSGNLDAQSQFLNADLSNLNLMGTVFGDVDFTARLGKYAAAVKNSNLAYANMTNVKSKGMSQSGIIRCGTLLPSDGGLGQPGDDMNNECHQLPGAAPWTTSPVSSCGTNSCAYVSLYNNTTRFLTLGNQTCKDGDALSDLRAPAVIAPLDTAQISFGPNAREQGDTKVDCSFTYANGPWGKVRVEVSNESGTMKATVNSGLCQSAVSDPNGCLPTAAPAKLVAPCPNDGSASPTAAPAPGIPCTPVPSTKTPGLWPPARSDGSKIKFDTSTSVKNFATYLDVSLCEPEAFTSGKCARTSALPHWDMGSASAPASPMGDTAPTGSSSAADLNAAAARMGAAGFQSRVTTPLPSGVAYSTVRDTPMQYGYTVSRGGNDVATVYTATGLNAKQLTKAMRKAAGSNPRTIPLKSGGKALAWKTPFGKTVAVAVTKDGTLISVTANSFGQLQELRAAFEKG